MEITLAMIKPISTTIAGSERTESQPENILESFSNILGNAIEKVNGLQKEAEVAVEKLVAGELDIHDVMIATEKSGVAMQLTIQLRNKILEAYQEIMRMQV